MEFEKNLAEYMAKWDNEKSDRMRSYDYCKRSFDDYHKRIVEDGEKLTEEIKDDFARSLYCFLASWGMVCRGSLLSEKSYKSLIPLCKNLFDPYYKPLKDINPLSDGFDMVKDGQIDMICCLAKRIRDSFGADDRSSLTLCGKIIMVTYGCALGYDTYVNEALGAMGKRHYSMRPAIEETYELISTEKQNLKKAVEWVKNKYHVDYTVFKILDMILWEYGKDH